jgi:alpha-glucosidase
MTQMNDAWWKSAVIYQVYPRSFQDSDGDGVGDLAGIRARLPYLVWLGVDAIWLSPIFVSPMADFGYDISDYTAVDKLFGTLADFDALLSEAHGCGLKVLLDLVPNHTSIEHPWFRESRASRQNAKRDWYIWRDGAPDGGPPNNWLSEFGGSAWTRDEGTGQYYYHAFLAAQPDLNWRNPQVRAAMAQVMRFWLDRGVDGFRVDVLWHLIKDDQFRDNPPNPDFRPDDPPHRRFLNLYSADRPEVHDVVRELRAVIDERPGRLLIGEIYLPLERLVAYYGEALSGAHLPFNFSLLETPWRARDIAALIARYKGLLPASAWPNWVLGNHDRPRIAGRVGVAQSRVAAMLLLTLRGTPTMYYGDEIGLPQVAIAPDEVRDPFEKNVPGLGLGRDGCRTPMQWDASRHAGFSAVRPWLRLSGDEALRNVETERNDPASLLSLYRRLIGLRRTHPALATGACRSVDATGDILAYLRDAMGERFAVVLNLGAAPGSVALPDGVAGAVILSVLGDRDGEAVRGEIELAGDDGLLIRLT